MDSFLTTAMEMLNSMMHFTGCELHSHKTRGLLIGLRTVIATFDDDRIGSILLLIDTLLEDEGVAEAETAAYHDYDDDYEDSDEYYDDCLCDDEDGYDVYDFPEPDPMISADEAFKFIELKEYDNKCFDMYQAFSEIALDKEAEDMFDDEDMNEWVHTPHHNINTELKQIDKEIADRKAAVSIQEARESVMKKIYFQNGDIYPIHDIRFEVDDNGIPVDITISTFPEYLDNIAENHCQLGYSQADIEEHGFKTALYGRLDSFGVADYDGLVMFTFIAPQICQICQL
jgi:hypothetical protein